MGKRKSRKKVIKPKKTNTKLPKNFDCPFCGRENSLECIMYVQNDTNLKSTVPNSFDELS